MKKNEAVYMANEIVAAIVSTITSDDEYLRLRQLAERDNKCLRDWLADKALDQVDAIEQRASERGYAE